MRLSIIIPVRNEAANIVATLAPLQARRGELELIMVDGGSSDDTAALAIPLVDHLISAAACRANQMNAGAAIAQGQWLLFLHADTQLPTNFLDLLPTAHAARQWGRFDVRLSPSSPMLHVVAWMMNWRSRLTGVCTGDQAIFVRRALFEQLGGYAPIPLMEDIELSKRLRKISPPLCLRPPLTTSSRRWQTHGTLRTIVLMWWLRWRYWRGAPVEELARRYQLEAGSWKLEAGSWKPSMVQWGRHRGKAADRRTISQTCPPPHTALSFQLLASCKQPTRAHDYQ